MKISPVIFREYDIRGIVGPELSEEFALLLGRAYGSMIREKGRKNVAVGYDCRHSSKGFASALAKGITDEGVDVTMVGQVPTPLLYYSIIKRNLGGGIQVTGSHNPSDMNGFKICVGPHSISGSEIQDLRTRMESIQGTEPDRSKKGKVTEDNLLTEYVEELIEGCRPFMGPRKLKVVVDAGNGVGGMTGVALLRGLGIEVVELFCDPNGDFPNHHPDPTIARNLSHLIAAVRENSADFGIGLDGDADRIGIVDEKGQPVFADMLLLLYAREILKTQPGATVIADVKCSDRLFNDLRERGADIIMSRTGHSLLKKKLEETRGVIAGELAGHICFRDRFFGFDDGVYCAARFAELVSNWNTPVSRVIAGLPQACCTPEIKMDCPEEYKFLVPEQAAEFFQKSYPVVTIDGARITFPHGWALVRASNTQSCMIMRFEADNENNLREYQEIVETKVKELKRNLEQEHQKI